MMSRNLMTLGLVASLAISLGGCWSSSQTEPSQAELDQARVDAANKKAAEEQAKREANADENGLVATSDPRVFKATKVLPKPESSVNAVKPEYPALGFEHSYEGAEAVAAYLERIVEYSYNTGDTTDLSAICSKELNYCKSILESITENELNGSWHSDLSSTNQRLIEWGVPNDPQQGEYAFHFNADLSDYKYFDREKMTLTKRKGHTLDLYVHVKYIDGRWVIALANKGAIRK